MNLPNFTAPPMPQSRYVLPSFEERTSYGVKQLDPYSKLFQDRVIFLGTQLDDVAANDIMTQLLVLEAIDSEADIVMYINSPGGSLTSLTAVYDTMQYIAPHVITVCLGQASSVSAILLAAGQKGKRAALPNARIMLHQPLSDGAPGQASDIEILAKQAVHTRSWVEGVLASATGQDLEKVSADIDREFYLTAAEALEYGLIDQVMNSRKRA
jgi:ATP-dependent Clp protease protease subunit